MFIQQKNNSIYRVSLTLERVLSPFWNLSRNLLKDDLLKKRDYKEYDPDFQQRMEERMTWCDIQFERQRAKINEGDGSAEEKKNKIATEEVSKYDSIFDEAFDCVLNYYQQKILSPECFQKQIKKSCSLIIYKDQGECYFVAEGDAPDRFDKEYRNCLFSMKLVEDFLKFLNGGIVEANSFNPKIYSYVFPDNIEDDAISITSPLYLKDVIIPKEGVVRESSEYEIWFNDKHLKTLGYDQHQDSDVYEYRIGDDVIGLEKGQYFIPMVTEWKNHFDVANESLIIWTDYKNKIYNNKEKDDENKQKPAKTSMTDVEKEFVDAAVASDEMTNLLSYLTDNLYLSEGAPDIAEPYKKFFDYLIKVEELKHLMDYKLYVPKQDDGTLLGVYKIHKLTGEREFNLRHFLYSEKKGETTVYKDYSDKDLNIATVQVLKPQYASFYMMDYYEFFVEEVLKALKQEGVIEGYLRNQKYSYRGQGGNKEIEIDALVYNGQKIFLLELKTTMHIEFLNIYPQRYAAVLADEEKPEIYEFHLISSFADDNIGILKFEEREGYNERRDGLNSVPYKFNVAIPVKESAQPKDLYCLSESSFSKLKTELEHVFS